MKYTIDNPKLVRNYYFFNKKSTFTGVVKDFDDNIAYYVNGEFHRTDGPAIEYSNGDKEWFLNGRRHRKGGPAIECDGSEGWYLNGKIHRTDGPAIKYSGGSKEWYLNGKCYGSDDSFTKESWIRFVRLELLK